MIFFHISWAENEKGGTKKRETKHKNLGGYQHVHFERFLMYSFLLLGFLLYIYNVKE